MTKIQLFVPPQGYVAQRWSEGTSMPPLGILFLTAVLEDAGFEVDVVPADVLGLQWPDVEQRIRDFAPDIVGATTTTENRFDSFRLVALAKQINPRTVTVLGGPHISMAAEDTMRHIVDLDAAVVGEGEVTLRELAQAVGEGSDLSRVPGVWIRNTDGEAIFTGIRNRIEHLDTLPYPARHRVPMDRYNFFVKVPDGRALKAQNIMTSRGCPFSCYFCATPANWGRKMRGHSPERVVNEIEHLVKEYGAEYIWFYDDTLNYNLPRLHRIMDLIIERRFDIKFCNEFRIDLVDKPLLEKMVRAGLVWAHFGVEAGSERVRREVVGKNFDIEEAYRFARWGKELGFVPDAFLIFSHHTETWEEAQETITVMERLRESNPRTDFATAILHVYPGTPLEAIAKAEKIIPADFSWSCRKDLKRVPLLPAAQGYVPLFKDRLTWFQIADLVMRWSASHKRYLSRSKLWSALKTLTSLRALGVYLVFFLTMLKYRFRRFRVKSVTQDSDYVGKL
ncbi:MAG: radical SAM protein [Candidatus Aminicenantaceae bacterium]